MYTLCRYEILLVLVVWVVVDIRQGVPKWKNWVPDGVSGMVIGISH